MQRLYGFKKTSLLKIAPKSNNDTGCMMAMKLLKYMIFLLSVSIAGCASLSREDCLYADWLGLGVKDGREGKEASNFIRHQDACSRYGVSLDKEQYLAGREQGLKEYCQLDNAIEIGLQGQRYESVCPANIHKNFRHYYETAYQVYQHKEALKSLDESLVSKEKALMDKKLPDKARQNIRDEIRQLDHKRRYLRDDLDWAERKLNRLRDEEDREHR
jgi:hypothetical protein